MSPIKIKRVKLQTIRLIEGIDLILLNCSATITAGPFFVQAFVGYFALMQASLTPWGDIRAARLDD